MIEIKIEGRYRYHASLYFGLRIEAPRGAWPLVVGCSLRTVNGDVIDQPARWLDSPGLALWRIEPGGEFREGQGIMSAWHGQVIFAAYSDDSLAERLADTGWHDWDTFWMLGASTVGLRMQDEAIQAKYGDRLEVWRDL